MAKKPIYVRIDEPLRADFDAMLEHTGMSEAQFVKAAIKALIEYVREHGEITLPLALIPKSERPAKPSKTEALKGGRPDAPVALPANPSTDSTRLPIDEGPPADSGAASAKRSAPPFKPRSAGSRIPGKRLSKSPPKQ